MVRKNIKKGSQVNSINFKTKALGFIMATALGSLAAAQSLSSITASPTSASTGQTVTVTVNLSDKCRNASCVIALSSSNAAIAPIAASVTISYDRKSASKTFVAGSAAAKTTITLSAVYNGVTKTTGSTFSVSPAVVVTPPPPVPAGTIVATYSHDGDSLRTQEGWQYATEYLSSAAADLYPNAIKAKYAACLAAHGGNGQLTAVGDVVRKSMVTVYPGISRYTVEQNFTCAAGYTGWLATSKQTSPASAWISIGATASFEICLVKPAPAGGVVAQLSAPNGFVSVPTSLTFAAGETCKSFTATAVKGQGNVERIYTILNGYRLSSNVGINF